MKKALLIIVLAFMLLFSSCGNTVVVYQQVDAYRAGNPTSSVVEQWERGYTFNTKEDFIYYDKTLSKEDSFYERTETLEYFGTKDYVGVDYQEEIYRNKEYIVYYNKDTQKIVGITALHLETPILQAEGLVTAEDFIEYAKTIADDFIDVEDYVVTVVPQEPPKPNAATAYSGDQYIFRKQLSGIDTAECVVVSITPDGAVGEIRHEAIGQFEEFEGIDLDPLMIDSAVEKAINAATPQTSGRVDVKEYDYYLMNDGGTLLLYLELTSTSTPINEDLTTDPANPVYREEDAVSIGTVAVVPLAEVRK